MPPKKKPRAEDHGIWQYRTDVKEANKPDSWSNYPRDQSDLIETAFQTGGNRGCANVGEYVVDTKKMTQYKKSDTSKVRVVRRCVVETTAPEGPPSESAAKKKTTTTVDEGSTVLVSEGSTLSRSSTAVARKVVPVIVGTTTPPPNIMDLISYVPLMNRTPLSQAATKMRPTIRQFLVDLGRDPKEVGQKITLAVPLRSMNARKAVAVGVDSADAAKPMFPFRMKELQDLAAAAKITYVKKYFPTPPTSILTSPLADMDVATETNTQLFMISGPVFVLFDNDYAPLRRTPTTQPIYMYSIPGINFAYSEADLSLFTECNEDDGVRIFEAKAMQRMYDIWAHVLTVMAEDHVAIPILCGIGCGAFRGKFGTKVPLLWARALHKVLTEKGHTFGFDTVLLSLPVFEPDDNFTPFKRVFENKPMSCPVVLMEDAGMIGMALYLNTTATASKRVGVLNPSDVLAIRHGYVGMFWDKGHIALEEVLAMQTTLLMHHIGLNESLFTNPARWIGVDI